MTSEAQERQRHYARRIWHHNSLIGRMQHAIAAAYAVINSETTTQEAKRFARQVEVFSRCTLIELRQRNPVFEAERTRSIKNKRKRERPINEGE